SFFFAPRQLNHTYTFNMSLFISMQPFVGAARRRIDVVDGLGKRPYRFAQAVWDADEVDDYYTVTNYPHHDSLHILWGVTSRASECLERLAPVVRFRVLNLAHDAALDGIGQRDPLPSAKMD